MQIKRVFLGVVGFVALACPTQGWSEPADVFPSFGAEKEVVSEVGDVFRGGAEGCADYVYKHTGIPPGLNWGFDATSWIGLSQKRGYSISLKEPQNNSVGLMAPGHVYFVGTVKKDGNDYKMSDIKQIKWNKNPDKGVYSKKTNTVQFNGEPNSHKSWGFITSLAKGKSIKWNK